MIYEGQEFATPQEALAHFGVKGMKWGVRKSEGSSSRPKASPETIARRKRIIKRVAIGAAVGIGVGVGGYLLYKNGKIPISSIKAAPTALQVAKTTVSANHPTAVRGAHAAKTVLQTVGTASAVATAVSPSYTQHQQVQQSLPDDMFMRYDDRSGLYVTDPDWGWNPNTTQFGRQDWENFR